MENKSFREGVQWAWDSTSIGLAMTCPRKYQYKLIKGYRPREESVHLLFGGLYATALEHFYKHIASGTAIEDALRLVVRETLEATWDQETGEPVAFPSPNKTRYNLIRSIIWYIEEFGDERESAVKTHHLKDGTPAVELSFSFDMDEEITLCGHLDRVVDYGGTLYVMDQKTTGSTISPRFFDQFNTSNQMSLYTLAGQVVLQTPVRGVIIDGAQIAVNFTRFSRGITYRSKEQLDEWWNTALSFIKLTQHYSQTGHFPMNLSSCGNYGGCEFRHVCAAQPRSREMILKADFIQETWDPIKRR